MEPLRRWSPSSQDAVLWFYDGAAAVSVFEGAIWKEMLPSQKVQTLFNG